VAYRTRVIRAAALAGALTLSLSSLSTIAAHANRAQANGLVQSNNQFAFQLFQQTSQQTSTSSTDNFVYSPYSIQEALALADVGARGTTDTQIRAALNLTLSQTDLAPAALALRTDLLARGNQGEAATPNATALATQAAAPALGTTSAVPARSLLIANALWGEQTYAFDPAYTSTIAANYGSGLHPIDFVNNPEPSRQAINSWVAQQTANHIPEIMSPGSITDGTRLVLVNAIAFHNGWAYHPDPKLTENGAFTLLDSTQKPISVPMMLMTDPQGSPLSYMQRDHFQVVDVPYAGDFGSMLIILPDDGQYAAVEKMLNAELFNTINAGLTSPPQQIRLALPRFTFSYGLDLRSPLHTFGLTDAFDPTAADFSGMGPKGLFIQAILHKAFIGVDENGTVAAAATGMGMGITSVREFTRLDINRPFIFIIRDPKTGLILFIGRVLNPLASGSP